MLPEQFSNLAFPGQGPIVGLNLVKAKATFPRAVFIEINKVEVGEHAAFTAGFANPAKGLLKRYVPAFREQHDPLAIVMTNVFSPGIKQVMDSALFSTLGSGFSTPRSGAVLPVPLRTNPPEKPLSDAEKLQSSSLFRLSYEQQWEHDSRLLPDDQLQRHMHELSQCVQLLTQAGVRVVFYEMPTSPLLESTPRKNQVRQAFARYFPPEKWKYLPRYPHNHFRTKDAIHIDNESIGIYSQWFLEQVKDN